MIDLGLLREHPQKFVAEILKKDPAFNAEELVLLDQTVRILKQAVEALRSKKNELAVLAKSGVTPELREHSKQIGVELKSKEQELNETEARFKELYLATPNLGMFDVPIGGKDKNKVVKIVGEKPTFDFPIKNHVELMEALGWVDFETATRIAGSNFVLYKKGAVSLMYALTNFMLKHNKKHGFEPTIPPVIVNETSLETSGNFPKFREQVYAMPADNLYLSPTSEVGLVNMYRGAILHESDLPLRHTAWTSCFRREAGTYGAHERGLIRIHQFEKVELVSICNPVESVNELERMVACAEGILNALGLHYRVSLLASEDMSFQAAKTYDIEVWLPGQNSYYEVSSCSNCTDFQARRGLIRYKKDGDNKTHLVHTLNASSLALPRLMVALVETYQQADGSIALPEVLQKESLI
ncbi:MAG TPA: serine--tRNA ligase [Candidatus Babeliales bacterium]|nr:serine--tRNA ligase [Candidatus Babeliales bacterium]